MKILILRFSSIGDIVLTTPVIRAIKKKYADARVHYVIKKKYLPVLQHNPYLEKIHIYEGSISSLISELHKENFDYVIDLQNNIRSLYLSFRLGKKRYSVNKINFRKWLIVNFKINLLPKKHIVERYFDAIKFLNVYPDGEDLDYFISQGDEVSNKLLPEGFGNGFAVFAIGGTHFTKKMPPEKIAEFATAIVISMPVIFIGGIEDKEVAEKSIAIICKDKFNGKTGKKELFYNACGTFTLNQSAFLIKQSSFVVTHDTGMMHIAAAYKKKIITLWGNTIPAFGMYPYKTPFLAVENNTLPCRPCTKIGYDHCPVSHFGCMMELKLDSIEINKFLISL